MGLRGRRRKVTAVLRWARRRRRRRRRRCWQQTVATFLHGAEHTRGYSNTERHCYARYNTELAVCHADHGNGDDAVRTGDAGRGVAWGGPGRTRHGGQGRFV